MSLARALSCCAISRYGDGDSPIARGSVPPQHVRMHHGADRGALPVPHHAKLHDRIVQPSRAARSRRLLHTAFRRWKLSCPSHWRSSAARTRWRRRSATRVARVQMRAPVQVGHLRPPQYRRLPSPRWPPGWILTDGRVGLLSAGSLVLYVVTICVGAWHTRRIAGPVWVAAPVFAVAAIAGAVSRLYADTQLLDSRAHAALSSLVVGAATMLLNTALAALAALVVSPLPSRAAHRVRRWAADSCHVAGPWSRRPSPSSMPCRFRRALHAQLLGQTALQVPAGGDGPPCCLARPCQSPRTACCVD